MPPRDQKDQHESQPTSMNFDAFLGQHVRVPLLVLVGALGGLGGAGGLGHYLRSGDMSEVKEVIRAELDRRDGPLSLKIQDLQAQVTRLEMRVDALIQAGQGGPSRDLQLAPPSREQLQRLDRRRVDDTADRPDQSP